MLNISAKQLSTTKGVRKALQELASLSLSGEVEEIQVKTTVPILKLLLESIRVDVQAEQIDEILAKQDLIKNKNEIARR